MPPTIRLPGRGFALVAMLTILLGLAGPPAGPAAAGTDNIYALSAASLQNQAAEVGTAFAENMSVLVTRLDRTGPGIDVPVTFTAPATGASGTFPGGSNVAVVNSGSNGIATAPALTANLVAGSFSVSVTAPQATPNAFAFTNTDDDPGAKAFSISVGNGSNQAAQINTTFGIQLSVAVFDSNGDHLPGIDVVFAAPSSGASGAFPGGGAEATVTTGPTGLATAPSLTANGTAGEYTVTATVDGEQTVNGDPLTASFALRNTLNNPIGVPEIVSAAAGNGQQTPVLTPFNTNLQVVVLDGSQDHVEGADVVFAAPTDGPSGTFAGGGSSFATVSGATGLATAPTLTANDEAGSYAVTVTATKDGASAQGVIGLTNGRVETSTVLAALPAGGSLEGQTVTLTATVTVAAGSLVPSADVEFTDDGATIGSCAAVTPSGGIATCDVSGLTPDTHEFQAGYLGDAVSQPSQSAIVTHDVTAIDPPGFAKSLSPSTILPGEVSRLTFTIDSSANTVAIPGLDFTDDLPAGVAVAAAPNPSSSCVGGTLTAVPGSGVVTYSGGEVEAGATCTLAVDVTSTASGTHDNVSGALTSAAGPSGTASASLTVGVAPAFSKSFAPVSILPGDVSRLTFTIDNSANTLDVGELAFTDVLPAGVAVASPAGATTDCDGGVVTAVAGGGEISYAGGTVAAGTACTIGVDVTSTASGMHENLSGELLSAAGSSGTAAASLEVATVATMFSVDAATGTGQITGSIAGGGLACGVESAAALDVSDVASAGPEGVELPHGLLGLVLGNCTPGASVDVTLVLPSPLGASPQYWKLADDWYAIAPINVAGNEITFTIVDGGIGDADGVADGAIVDPGGPGQAAVVDPPATSEPQGTPATSEPGVPATSEPGVPATSEPGDPATSAPDGPATTAPGDPGGPATSAPDGSAAPDDPEQGDGADELPATGARGVVTLAGIAGAAIAVGLLLAAIRLRGRMP